MPPRADQEVRPRTTGEILDDAWRLYLTDAPLLLALYGLFLAPACGIVLLLVTQVGPEWVRYLWAALAAVLLPLTGLGAGACQEAYHLWTEGRPVSLGKCLRPACRRGVNHVATQTLSLILPMIAVFCLVVPEVHVMARWSLALLVLAGNLPIWLIGMCRHAVLAAGQKNLWRSWRSARRASSQQVGKAIALAFARAAFLLLTIMNLHLFLHAACYAGEELGGLDLAFVSLQLSLGNPVYLLALVALALWLLAPWNEAVNYLFLVDARTRYEGLDLWFRIEEAFPVAKVGALLMAVVGATLLTAAPVRADRLQEVQSARKEVADTITAMKNAEPYPGGKHWQKPLNEVAKRLDPKWDARHSRYRWFSLAVSRLGDGDRAADLEILRGVSGRLGLVEESLQRPAQARPAGTSVEEVRKLVPGDKKKRAKHEEPPPKVEEDRPQPKEQRGQRGDFGGRVPAPNVGLVAPQIIGGLGYALLWVFIGLMIAVVLVAAALLNPELGPQSKAAGAPEQGALAGGLENLLEDPERQNVSTLWRQSDDLARAGRFLEAVRTLYLAVLALLHQSHLIRYERTRTNGEYADQLRRREPLHAPFVRLTGLFELKWYGERSCQEADYQSCRTFAETIQQRGADAFAITGLINPSEVSPCTPFRRVDSS